MTEDSLVASLFPGWSSPRRVAAFVTGRALLDAVVVAAAGLVAGPLARQTLVALALTVAATPLSYVVLGARTSEARAIQAGRVEMLLRLGEVTLCGLLAAESTTTLATVGVAVLGVAVVLFTLVTVPLYGEATVAP